MQEKTEDKKFIMYEKIIANYEVNFIDLRMNTYLKNLHEFYERYYPLNRIVNYKSKLTSKSLRSIIQKIKDLRKKINDERIFSKIDFFLYILIFDMKVFTKISKIKKSLKNLCSNDYLKLLLLNLLLFIEYEEKYLFLSDNSFEILRDFILLFIDQLSDSYMEDYETIEVIDILFEVSSKVYTTNVKKQNFDLSLVKFSLLNILKNTSLYNVRNFWNNYFSFKFQNIVEKKLTPKSKIIKVTDIMVYYNYFLSEDIEFTMQFIETCLPVKSINFNIIKKTCILKIKQELYHFNKELLDEKIDVKKNIDKKSKLKTIFSLLIKKEFVDKEIIIKILTINKKIKIYLSKIIVKKFLRQIPSNSLKRKDLWIRYINLNKKKPKFFRLNSKVTEIDKRMLDQIKIDVLRTKYNKGTEYQKILEDIILEFFENYNENLEYFQGFNYITSFLYEYFPDKKIVIKILDYISNYILKDYFSDDLTFRLNIVHFQLNNLIKVHYPNLSVHWMNININSEILFSSFIISLFTSLLYEDISIVLTFWDIILTEKWIGIIYCILFIVDINYEDLLRYDSNNSLKFFSELKTTDYLHKKMKTHDFKDFVFNFKLNLEHFFEMELKFNTINQTSIEKRDK